ncbi:glycosyltransferase family 39 protein [Pedobacter sp. SYSU D00535]|uniref:ArnT family glycosyltransferase n=1 Tax=Pedobacter sp. SYSU D00535 TaxID=2810308 RepID=UPI001A97BD7E|nr:glycosyltransferase family 39 protein [Pedobacter sp. SYSU D00535]
MGKLKINGIVVFLVSLVLLLLNLGQPMIYILDEAKNAECAREMLVSGDFFVPNFNGQLRTDKPPLHYFFMVLSYKIFGVSAFSARFFSAVFGALTVLISFLFTRRYLGETASWLTALILIASLHFNFQMRLAVPDPYLIFFMTACFMCFYLYYSDGKKQWLWLMYAAFGLGVLTKGPVAIGLPGLVMFLFLLISRNFNVSRIKSFHIPAGTVIVLLIALPWYLLNYIRTNGEWTEGFFLKHNLQRYTDTMEGHGGFFLLPIIMVVLGLVPFGVFGIQSVLKSWKERHNHFLLFSLIIVATIVIFFSFSQTKLPNYTAPAYPFAAILIAFLLKDLDQRVFKSSAFLAAFGFYTFLALAIPAGVFIAFRLDPKMEAFAYLALYFLLLPAGALLGWRFLKSAQYNNFIYAVSLSFVVTNILFFAFAYPAVYSKNPVSASFEALQKQEELVYYKMMNPAYVFNLKRVIPGFHTVEELKSYVDEHPHALIISREKYQAEIDSAFKVKVVFEQQDTFEKPVTVILQKSKN